MQRTTSKLTSLASTLQKLNTPPPSTLSKPTPSSSPTHLEILHAYRHLLRTSLHAIHYSTPARHVLLSRLRLSFRSSPLSSFEPTRIANTLQFLRNAGETTGIEHKILRNLLHVWYWEPTQWQRKAWVKGSERVVVEGAYGGFYWGIRMLNESCGLCIR